MTEMKPKFVKLTGTEKYARLLAGAPETGGMKSGYVTLKPGEAVGAHKTAGREEAIIILEGKASVYGSTPFGRSPRLPARGESSCEEKLLFTAEAESLVYIPPETLHDIKNDGQTNLRYVYVVTPVPETGKFSL